MAGPASGNVWLANKVTVRDHSLPFMNAIWARVTRVWDAVMHGIRFDYQNRAYADCDDLDRVEGGIVICSNGPREDVAGSARIWTDHHEITHARIWFFAEQESELWEHSEEEASHEFGHAIGLNHYGRRDAAGKPVSIMHPLDTIGSPMPKPVDLAALHEMGYGAASQGHAVRRKHARKR